MKILLTSESYSFQINGIANAVRLLADTLIRYGHDVRVLTLSDTLKSFKHGNEYYIASFPSVYYQDIRISPVLSNRLLRELIEWHPDIIHIHTEGSTMRMAKTVSKADKVPIVMTSHTDYERYVFGSFHNSAAVRALMYFLGRIYYAKAAAVVVPSEKGKTMPHICPDRDRCFVIPNGIRTERFGHSITDEARKRLLLRIGADPKLKTLILVSRISKEKNIGEIVDYFSALSKKRNDVQLVIVGGGPALKKIRLNAERTDTDRIIFTGKIPYGKIDRYYKAGDIFVCASTFETQGLTYLEAAASGLPLVCRNDDALNGILINGANGFAYNNKREFIGYVEKILDDDRLSQRMGRQSLKISSKFTAEQMADKTLRLYNSIIH